MIYTKYSASGNDFIIFHTIKEADFSEMAKKICNRFDGIGADGLIVIVPDDEFDYKWLFYNSDGSTASMCGNGSRACAHYANFYQLASSNHTFITLAGPICCNVDGDVVRTALTEPFEIYEQFEEEGLVWWGVDTGVPHLVAIVDDLSVFDKTIAAKLRYKYNANINYAQILDGKIYVRTYERGVEDETQACGTGMAACFLRAKNLELVGDMAFVYPKSKEELTLSFENETLFFQGKVKKLFTICDYFG